MPTNQHELENVHIPKHGFSYSLVKGLTLGLLTVFLCGTYAADERASALPPPFKARAFVRTSEFLPGVAQPQFTKETEVIFSHSNTWWRIDAIPIGNESGVLESCMTIPGGTRYLAHPMNPLVTPTGKKPAASATACPMMFPPPGRGELFRTWLMFCPQPKLPIKDSNQIYRLLSIPECETEIFFHSNNLGNHSISFVGDAGKFVSELRITNRGNEIELVVTPTGFESKFHRLQSPFQNGYLEYDYTLLSTTNYLGFAYPARAVVRRMMPTFNLQQPGELFTRVLTEIQIISIGGFDQSTVKNDNLPKEVVVSDMRFTNLPANASITYQTSDDAWKSTTDPKIAYRAQQLKKTPRETDKATARHVTRISLFILALSSIAIYLRFEYQKRLHNHHNQNRI